MSFKFEKLRIWQLSMEFGESIYKLSLNFPKDESFNLTSQIRRASDSIALEFRKFLGYSIRSLAEVVTCLYKAKNRKYISEEEFSKLYNESYSLMNQVIAFRNQIKE